MANREKQKIKYPRKLEPVPYDKEWYDYRLSNVSNAFDIKVILDDYDWMFYTFAARLPTRTYGDIKIKFEYAAVGFSMMTVSIKTEIYFFRFDMEIFKEHIIKYIQKHIGNWGESAFDGVEEVVNFYNAVIMSPNTVQENHSYFR